MNKLYRVAGHCFLVSEEVFHHAVKYIVGFQPFEISEGDPLFSFETGTEIPVWKTVQFEFDYEDVHGTFGRTDAGFMLQLKPAEEEAFYLWNTGGESVVRMCGNWSLRLYRFAMWVGYGLMTLPFDTLAIHSSCIVCHNQATLFLGESGTGKSTHTRLWREYIEGAFLLNDDSPMLRVEDGRVWVYGSPWSGKTPCYKNERYELRGCVRLSQAPFNRIKKLSILEAYGAIHPSCAPEFAYDNDLYNHISNSLDKLLSTVPFYHLSCLPDGAAALLSHQTLFPHESDTE